MFSTIIPLSQLVPLVSTGSAEDGINIMNKNIRTEAELPT